MEQQAVYEAERIVASKRKSLILESPDIRGGFAQIPNVILRDPHLSPNAKALYGLLLSYAWQDKECFPGQDSLAHDMGCNRQTIGRILQELRGARLVTWERRGLGETNVYTIKRLDGGYLPRQYVDRGSNGS